MKTKLGFAIQITRKDKTKFMACSSHGTETPVWHIDCRLGANAYCQELNDYGFKARVVKVRYAKPEVVK